MTWFVAAVLVPAAVGTTGGWLLAASNDPPEQGRPGAAGGVTAEATSGPPRPSRTGGGAQPTRKAPPPTPARSTADTGSTDDDGTEVASEDLVKGDCVVNRGADDDPKLEKVACGPGTYEVLLKIPLTTDDDKCYVSPVGPDTDRTLSHDSDRPGRDFVLCFAVR